MPPSHLTPAIVLRARPFGESDKIVYFLTQHLGKITGIAKGAKRSRRRFANSLEPFSLINLHLLDYPHRSLVFVVGADLLVGFSQLANSLVKIAYASYMVEITEGLIAERDSNASVFHHLKDGLRYLDKNDVSLSFLTSFELKLLRLTGYQPHLDSCKHCGQGRRQTITRWHFSFREGGIFCDLCARARKETPLFGATTIEVLRELQTEHGPVPSRMVLPSSVVREIRSLVLQFIQFQMDRQIRSAPFLYDFALI